MCTTTPTCHKNAAILELYCYPPTELAGDACGSIQQEIVGVACCLCTEQPHIFHTWSKTALHIDSITRTIPWALSCIIARDTGLKTNVAMSMSEDNLTRKISIAPLPRHPKQHPTDTMANQGATQRPTNSFRIRPSNDTHCRDSNRLTLTN